MTPGSIILHDNFVFQDGVVGKKYLIILASHNGESLMVKTTSQGSRYLNDYGCQLTHRFPHFHLVRGCCCFPLPTWVCLDEFYLFKDKDLLVKHFKGDVYKFGDLTAEIHNELLGCAQKSDDISELHANIINNYFI